MPNIFKRSEVKYLLTAEQRKAVEAVLKDHMIPDEHGESTIRNIYFDTPSWQLIRNSIEKPVYKEKLRNILLIKLYSDQIQKIQYNNYLILSIYKENIYY